MTKRHRRIPNTIAELIAPADVADLLRRFEREHLGTCKALILIAIDDQGHLGIESAGIDEEIKLLGALEFAKSVILSDDDDSEEDEA